MLVLVVLNISVCNISYQLYQDSSDYTIQAYSQVNNIILYLTH